MTKKEMEKRKSELMAKIDEAKEEEMEELRNQIEALAKEEITEEKEAVDERSLLKETLNNLETRSLKEVKVIEKPKEEERKVEENEILEQRGADLKAGKAIKVELEERSTVVSSGVLIPKKYKNTIDESFEAVSGLVDRVNSIPLEGGESYSVPFEKSYGEGGYTDENGEYVESDPVTDYVDTGRAKITAYSEISKEAIKLPNANYQALVIKRVKDSIRKKIGKQLIIGAGTTNTIRGIYQADTKVLPTGDETADIYVESIDADTLNTIVFAYGGDESVEAEQVLILSKKDLEKFAKIKIDDKFVYKITRKGQTGTIAYANGGLDVPYVINSACGTLSDSETNNGDYTMVYGSLSSYEMPIFSELEIEESKDYNFKKGMVSYRGDVIVGGTVSKYNGFVRVKKGTEISG